MTTPLNAWFAGELMRLWQRDPAPAAASGDHPGVMLGVAAWGPKYITLFERFCLASLLAPANLAALKAHQARLVVFTGPDGLLPLWRVTHDIEAAGIKVQLCPIPRELLETEDAGPYLKLEVLGAVQNLLVQGAALAGLGIHVLHPDHIYSERYFDVLLHQARRHEAIAHGAVSALLDGELAGIVDTYRTARTLSIPARDLGELGWRHLHAQMRPCLLGANVDDGDRLPATQNLIWLGREALHFAGPIFNPVWIGPKLARRAPVHYPTTLDAELPKLMPDGFWRPAPSDDMVLLEVSDATKGTAGKAKSPFAWLSLAWLQMNFSNSYLPAYRQRTEIPIEPKPDGLDDSEIERQHALLMQTLVASKLAVMEAYFEGQDRLNRPFLRVP